MKPHLLGLVGRLRGTRVVVVGDVVLDEYVYGQTHRVSREAPVLILKHDYHEYRLGGAANAAHNVTALGGTAVSVGVIGGDEQGTHLRETFERAGVATRALVSHPEWRTVTKTRVVAGAYHTSRQQLLRIDRGATAEGLPRAVRRRLEEQALAMVKEADAVLLSDYGYGLLDGRMTRLVIGAARRLGIPVVADSRYRLREFRGATVATPNEQELMDSASPVMRAGRQEASLPPKARFARPLRPPASPATRGERREASEARRARLAPRGGARRAGVDGSDEESALAKVGRAFMRRLSWRGLIITRGRSGMLVFDSGSRRDVVALPIVGSDQVTDVTGAGDTVAGTVALGLGSGLTLVDAARLATYAASVVVMKQGTATVSHEELRRAIVEKKQNDRAERPSIHR